MRFAARVAILLFVGAAAAAVTNSVRPDRIRWAPSYDDVYPPVPADIPAVSRQQVEKALGEGVIVIDARAEEKYRNGHIPTAHNLPAHAAEEKLGEVYGWVPTFDSPVIIYCSGGAGRDRCDESEAVYKLLKASGYTKLDVYFGGWEDWTKAGMAVEETPEQGGNSGGETSE